MVKPAETSIKRIMSAATYSIQGLKPPGIMRQRFARKYWSALFWFRMVCTWAMAVWFGDKGLF